MISLSLGHLTESDTENKKRAQTTDQNVISKVCCNFNRHHCPLWHIVLYVHIKGLHTNTCDSHDREETAGVNPGITAALTSRLTVSSLEKTCELRGSKGTLTIHWFNWIKTWGFHWIILPCSWASNWTRAWCIALFSVEILWFGVFCERLQCIHQKTWYTVVLPSKAYSDGTV